jgi:hypothetical protein
VVRVCGGFVQVCEILRTRFVEMLGVRSLDILDFLLAICVILRV